MSSAKWRQSCLGLNVLNPSDDGSGILLRKQVNILTAISSTSKYAIDSNMSIKIVSTGLLATICTSSLPLSEKHT